MNFFKSYKLLSFHFLMVQGVVPPSLLVVRPLKKTFCICVFPNALFGMNACGPMSVQLKSFNIFGSFLSLTEK